MNSVISRALFTTGGAAAAVLLAAGAANAHVTVDAPGAAQGGYAVLTFKVPTESETAGTTKLSVELPNLSAARPEPMVGWKSVVEKNPQKQATSVTWTADPGVSVAPDQFQRFALAVGPLPKQDSVSFQATQTYSDGKVVEWNQPENSDGSEPDHPAPSITLAAASGDEHGGGHTTDTQAEASDSTDSTARWLGGIGLALGALGAALGIGAVIRGRRS